MRVIVAGSRHVADSRVVRRAIDASAYTVTELVHGGCRGVDQVAGLWAQARGIPVRVFAADWRTHGKAAGPIRNRAMAEYAEALVAVWDGESLGTRNMIDEADARGLFVFVYRVPTR